MLPSAAQGPSSRVDLRPPARAPSSVAPEQASTSLFSQTSVDEFQLGGANASRSELRATDSARESGADLRIESPHYPPQHQHDASIDRKLSALNSPAHRGTTAPHRNQQEMRQFLEIMQGFDPKGSDTERTAVLNRATPHFLLAFHPSLNEIEGPQREAGQWINMHNWAGDVLALLPTAIAAGVQVAIARNALEDRAPGEKLPPPPLAPPLIALVGSLLNLLGNPALTKRWVQPALTQQRIVRTIMPARAGGAVDVDQAISGMRREAAAAEQHLRGTSAAEQGLDDIRDRLETAIAAYDEASATTRQRTTLYMPENYVRIARACAIPAASWLNYGLARFPESRVIPTVLLAQVVSYLAAATANYQWAGPKRDRLLRDGSLHVDFTKEAPALAARLNGPDGAAAIDEAMTWGRGVYKSQLEVRLEMTQTLVQEKIDTTHDDLALLLGLSHVDVAKMHMLQARDGPLPDDDAQLRDQLTVVFDDAVARFRQERGGESLDVDHLHSLLDEVRKLNLDRQTLKTMQRAAAQDLASDTWRTLSPMTKDILDLALSRHESLGFVSRYVEFMFKGARSRIDSIRFAHNVADSVRRDWRNYNPDAFLKFAKAAQMGVGGSLVPLIVSAAFGIASAKGMPPSLALRAVLTAVPFLLYVGCEIYQGTLVNATIAQRKELMADYPSRQVWDGYKQRYAKQFFFNMWRLPQEGLRQVRGAAARKRAVEQLAALPRSTTPT